MNTDEAWESFIGIRKSSAQGYRDTVAAALNKIETDTANLTKLTNRLLGDQGMLEDSAGGATASSPTDDLSGPQDIGGKEMAQEDINEDRNALDEALGVIDQQVGASPDEGGAVPPAPAEGGPEEGVEATVDVQEGMGMPMDEGLPKPEANFATECIQFSEKIKRELQNVANQGDYYKARRLIEIITAIDKIIDSDNDPGTILKSDSMEKATNEPMDVSGTPDGRARRQGMAQDVRAFKDLDVDPEKTRVATNSEYKEMNDAYKGSLESSNKDAREHLLGGKPSVLGATRDPTGRMDAQLTVERGPRADEPNRRHVGVVDVDQHNLPEPVRKSEDKYDIYEDYPNADDFGFMREMDGIPSDAMRTPYARGNSRMPYDDETSSDRYRVSYERDARMAEPEYIVGDGAVEENMVTPGQRALHGPNGGDRLPDPVQEEAEGAFLKSNDGQTADPMPTGKTCSSEGGRRSMPMPKVDMEKADGGAQATDGMSGSEGDTQVATSDSTEAVAASCSGAVKKSIPSIRELMAHRQGGEADPYMEFAKAHKQNLQYDIEHDETFQKSTAEKPAPFSDLMAKYRKG